MLGTGTTGRRGLGSKDETPHEFEEVWVVGEAAAVGVDSSSPYWLGSSMVRAPFINWGCPGFDPRSSLFFLFLQPYNVGPQSQFLVNHLTCVGHNICVQIEVMSLPVQYLLRLFYHPCGRQ